MTTITSAVASEHRVSGSSGKLSVLAIGAAGAVAISMILVQLARPDLDPTWRPISDYALGDHGWLMTLAFFAWGVAVLAATARLLPIVRGRLGRAALILLGLGGLGPIVAGIFPGQDAAAPSAGVGVSATLHGVGAVLGDGVPLGALLLTIAVCTGRERLAPRVPLAVTAGLALAAVGWVTASLAIYAPTGQLGPDTSVGWANRGLVVAHLVVVLALVRLRPADRPNRP